MLSPEMTAVIDFLEMMKSKTPTDFEVDDMRKGLDKMVAMMPLPDDGIYEPARADGVPAEWISTPGAKKDQVVLYLHGGGYVAGSIASHREMLTRLARETGRYVLALDYRLAPENPFPAALEDAVGAYRWLAADQQIDPTNITIAGDSAGGGLTLATLLKLKEDGDPMPRAAVCLSPWTDLAMTGESITTRAAEDPFIVAEGAGKIVPFYTNGDDSQNPLISPLYGDPAGLPPLLIHVGTRECLLDDSVRFADKAKAAGVPVTLEVWEDLIHVFHLFAPMAPEGREGIRKIAAFLKAV